MAVESEVTARVVRALCRWAEQEVRREVEADLSTLRQAPSRLAVRLVRFLDTRSPIERIEILTAGMRRILGCWPDSVTSERTEHLLRERDQAVLAMGTGEERRGGGRIRASRLRRAVVQKLGPLGSVAEEKGKSLVLKTPVGECGVITQLYFGTTPSYFHTLVKTSARSNTPTVLRGGISLFCWLGVGQTVLDLAGCGEEEAVATFVVDACIRFLDSAPVILGVTGSA